MILEKEIPLVISHLRGLGYKVIEPPPPPPENKCVVCGMTDDENYADGYGPLIDIQVITANGEEGFANPIRYFCQEDAVYTLDQLILLGFSVHRHGGINFLEPTDCPGSKDMDACPTPVDREDDYALD